MLSSGGVCAVLDYEIDQMTEYIAEMAQRLVMPSNSVSPGFVKFVSGLLSSTRLPSTTILLGMNYLARRSNTLISLGDFNPTDGIVYRMLTICLLLGSKFLDDNTFQNRSWSEVSGIHVSELNEMEAEWLSGMNYEFYVNLDENPDFNAWIDNWNHWRDTKNIQRKATLDRLAPLAPVHTNATRSRPYSAAYSAQAKSAHMGRDHGYEKQGWNHAYATPPYLTPPSAPDSAVNTPEYMSATGGPSRYTDWSSFDSFAPGTYARGYQPQMHATYVPAQVPAYHAPYHVPEYHYGPNMWAHSPHCHSCSCYGCNEYRCTNVKNAPFFPTGFGQQQIMA